MKKTRTTGRPMAPTVWPLVMLAGAHAVEAEAHKDTDRGDLFAMKLLEAAVDAVPTDTRDVGAILLMLVPLVEDLRSIGLDRQFGVDTAKAKERSIEDLADRMQYILARAAGALWTEDEWNSASERVFGFFSSEPDRLRMDRELRDVGLPGIPESLTANQAEADAA